MQHFFYQVKDIFDLRCMPKILTFNLYLKNTNDPIFEDYHIQVSDKEGIETNILCIATKLWKNWRHSITDSL